MPQFNRNATDRIKRVVRRVEQTYDNATPDRAHDRSELCEVPITFSNDSGATVPASGIIAVTGGDKTGYPRLTGNKPSGTFHRTYAVNGGNDVAASGQGQCYVSGWVVALYDTGTPAVDEVWVSKSGQWTLTKGSPGAPWGVVVAGIVDSTNKILLGKIVETSALVPRILYDDVAPGGNGLAWPVDSSMAADTSATKVTVYNTFDGTYRGLGTNHTGFTPSPTAKIWTTIGTDGHETIVTGVGQAKECTCQLTGALTATTASCTVDTVTPTDGGQNPVANSTSATMTVYIQLNPSSSGGYAGADNTVAKIRWHGNEAKYYIEDMPCPA